MSSVNYDPQKAHEYYEKHKELKGRHSTRKFTQTQKEQWDYAKHQLSEEHKQIGKKMTEKSKKVREQYSEQAREKIKQLREQFKGLSKEQKAMARERLNATIGKIRDKLKQDKATITAVTKYARGVESQEYAKRKDAAYENIKSMG